MLVSGKRKVQTYILAVEKEVQPVDFSFYAQIITERTFTWPVTFPLK